MKEMRQSSLLTQVAGLHWNLAVPRQLRIQYHGAIYHLMSRENGIMEARL
jgi:hypothetical protein